MAVEKRICLHAAGCPAHVFDPDVRLEVSHIKAESVAGRDADNVGDVAVRHCVPHTKDESGTPSSAGAPFNPASVLEGLRKERADAKKEKMRKSRMATSEQTLDSSFSTMQSSSPLTEASIISSSFSGSGFPRGSI